MTKSTKKPWDILSSTRDAFLYEWASRQRGELGMLPGIPYLESSFSRRALYRLENMSSLMLAFIGLQGTGKTSLANYLYSKLPSVVLVKWVSLVDALEKIFDPAAVKNMLSDLDDDDYEDDEDIEDPEAKAVVEVLTKMAGVHDYSKTDIHYYGEDWTKVGGYMTIRGAKKAEAYGLEGLFKSPTKGNLTPLMPAIKKILGKKGMIELSRRIDKKKAIYLENILIEFQDYHRSLSSQRQKDMSGLQSLWQEVMTKDGRTEDDLDKRHPNIVVFWQQELWDDQHFLQGKFEVIRIEPTSSVELVQYYFDVFESYDPFTKEALIFLADTARGVWRWWKKYIVDCLDKIKFEGAEPPVTEDMAREWIDVEKVIDDWARELAEIWPKERGMRNRAVKIIRYLQHNGETSQSEIAAKFFGAEGTGSSRATTSCSRFLDKLEQYDYIRRERKGREKFVSYSGVD